MGLGTSKGYLEEVSDSDTDSEEEYFNNRSPKGTRADLQMNQKIESDAENNMTDLAKHSVSQGTPKEWPSPEVKTDNNTVDAQIRPHSMPYPKDVLTVERVREIEEYLDEYEIVSLVYLLCNKEETSEAAKDLTHYKRSDSLLTTWAAHEKPENNWQLKLVEALCIIQNYKLLKMLGYKDKIDLKNRFCPHIGTLTESVEKTRKILYLIAEKLDETKTKIFLHYMKLEFSKNHMLFCEHNLKNLYLEVYFLDWEGLSSFKTIIKSMKNVLKRMNLEVLADNLAVVEQHLEASRSENTVSRTIKPSNSAVKKPHIEAGYPFNYKNNPLNLPGAFPCKELVNSAVEEPPIEAGHSFNYCSDPLNLPGAFPCENLNHFHPYADLPNKIDPFYQTNVSSNPVSNLRFFPERRVAANPGRGPFHQRTDTIQGYTEGGEYSEQPSTMNSSMSTGRKNSDTCYHITTEKPGKVLIIDQKDFYTEPEEKYAKLLHKNNNLIQLDTRTGTEKDRHRLENLFRDTFGFEVLVEKNLTHYDLVKVITEFVDSITDESSMFICILSHGEKGIVYGSNSCGVPHNKIVKIMDRRNKENLSGKPKVLILQACQGLHCQKMEDNDMSSDEDEDLYTRDGCSSPKTADILIFNATVPGYAAVRNKIRGSWFIQALCEAIETYHKDKHFLDICIHVNNMVSNKKWKQENGTNVMMSMLECTFRKSFYFLEKSSNKCNNI